MLIYRCDFDFNFSQSHFVFSACQFMQSNVHLEAIPAKTINIEIKMTSAKHRVGYKVCNLMNRSMRSM